MSIKTYLKEAESPQMPRKSLSLFYFGPRKPKKALEKENKTKRIRGGLCKCWSSNRINIAERQYLVLTGMSIAGANITIF